MVARRVYSISPQAGRVARRERLLAEEVPVALIHDGATHAVMMASPLDMEDFAVGFALSEGVISSGADIRDLEVLDHGEGLEVRLWLSREAGRSAIDRRRLIAGPTGCGLCGVDSIAAARAPARRVTDGLRLTLADVAAAAAALAGAQPLGERTRATHAAALFHPVHGLVALREDVGRHNALDKLIGHVDRSGIRTDGSVAVITSRVSVEMVQKAAVLGVEVLVAVSAPTSLAAEVAENAGLTLVCVARDDGFEVVTHPHRLPELQAVS